MTSTKERQIEVTVERDACDNAASVTLNLVFPNGARRSLFIDYDAVDGFPGVQIRLADDDKHLGEIEVDL